MNDWKEYPKEYPKKYGRYFTRIEGDRYLDLNFTDKGWREGITIHYECVVTHWQPLVTPCVRRSTKH